MSLISVIGILFARIKQNSQIAIKGGYTTSIVIMVACTIACDVPCHPTAPVVMSVMVAHAFPVAVFLLLAM